MKKVLSVVAIVLIMGGCLVSCADKKSCYEIKYSVANVSVSLYFWGTKADAEVAAQTYGSAATIEKTSKSESECLAF